MKRPIRFPTAEGIDDVWQRRATAAAIEGARKVVKADGVIPPGTPIGRLGDTEWGWIVAAILFGWISTRAEQATSEGLDVERTIRTTGLDPDPWGGGAVISMLPELAETPGVDWTKPLGEWPCEMVVRFLLKATQLIRDATAARDNSDRGVTRSSSVSTISRQANAAAGGPLLAPDELDDDL